MLDKEDRKEACRHCVPYGWDDSKIWFKKLGRKFGISPTGLGWLSALVMFILVTRVPVDSGRSWGTYLVGVIYVGSLFTLLSWFVFHLPTWIYRALWGKYQAAFNLDKVEHIHDMDCRTGDFLMRSVIHNRLYVKLGFGLGKKSAIMRDGVVDDNYVRLSTSSYEGRMLCWRSVGNSRTVSSMEIKVPLEELLSLIDHEITRPSQLLARADRYSDIVDENLRLQQRVDALEGGGFCERTARYMRAIIHDLKSSKRAHQSKVGERTRLLLEAVSERLELREANPDDQLGVIELETWIKQRSSADPVTVALKDMRSRASEDLGKVIDQVIEERS